LESLQGINHMDDKGGDVGDNIKKDIKDIRWMWAGLIWDTIESIGRRL
jgi:hypothetical protein